MPALETYPPLSLDAAMQEICDLVVDNTTQAVTEAIMRKVLLRAYSSFREFAESIAAKEYGRKRIRATTDGQSNFVLNPAAGFPAKIGVVGVYRSEASDYVDEGLYVYTANTQTLALSLPSAADPVAKGESFFVEFFIRPNAPDIFSRTQWRITSTGVWEYRYSDVEAWIVAGTPNITAGAGLSKVADVTAVGVANDTFSYLPADDDGLVLELRKIAGVVYMQSGNGWTPYVATPILPLP